jgi:ferredoxin
MPRVRFVPSGKHFDLVPNGSLLRAAMRAGLPVARSCRGVGVCAACRVRIVAGEENLAPMGPVEVELAKREPLRPGERYACLARVRGEVTITTTYW